MPPNKGGTMYLPDTFEFRNPVKTSCGKRSLEMLPLELSFMGAVKPLILCGNASTQDGRLKSVTGAFRGCGMVLGVYDDVPRRFSPKVLDELVGLYRDRDCDAIIAIGDSSTLNTAKILNLVISMNQRDLTRFDGGKVVQQPLKPLLAVLTCSGDGFETSAYAHAGKQTLVSGYLAPDIAFIDPRIVAVFQPKKVLSAAMSALTHSIESFVHPKKNPLTDAYAGSCIRLVIENLMPALSNQKSASERCALTGAFQLGCCAISNTGTGEVHALAEILQLFVDVPEGILMGSLLPHAIGCAGEQNVPHFESLLLPVGGFEAFAAKGGGLDNKQITETIAQLVRKLQETFPDIFPGSLPQAGVCAEMKSDVFRQLDTETGIDADMCKKIWETAMAA